MLKDIKTTEISKYLTGKRLEYHNVPFDYTVFPEAQVRGKLAKNRGWSVCKSWIDNTNKQFCYEVVVNANDTELRIISFDDACKDYGWKSFKLINNDQTIKFKKA